MPANPPPRPERRAPLDVDGTAAYLGTTPRHVRRLRSERRLAAIKLGGRVLFDPDDLDALLEASKERPA